MMYKKLWVGMVVAATVLSTAVASASTGKVIQVPTDDGSLTAIDDGRINAFDIGAPVVVFYDTQATTLDDGTVAAAPDGIDLLAVNQATNNGNLVLHASTTDIQKLLGGKESTLSANGYTLNYNSKNGWFWISAPADSEGKVYTFAWENTAFQAQ
ncbi:MAG: hypothetical protein ABI690_20530 [Chloroflexota bacterium]